LHENCTRAAALELDSFRDTQHNGFILQVVFCGHSATEEAVMLLKVGVFSLILCLLLAHTPGTASPFSKNTITFPDDPFAVPGTNTDPGWIKFTILTDDLTTVIFQDSTTYPFHYDFATNELAPFLGMSPSQFDAVTLHETNQQAILGAVILPPLIGGNQVIPEFGIQFVRQDPYDPVLVRDLFYQVRASVISGPEVQAFYFPSFEQQESAEANAAYFASEGITISSTARWASGNACYSHGWALGRLKYFPGDQIDGAYLAGDLTPDDVLLTDAVPAEIPFVSGVISLSPSTPNSHVVILAQTFNVPFAHLAIAADAQRAQDLVDRNMVLRVDDALDSCHVRLIDVESELDQPTIDSILQLKRPPALDITPTEPYGAYSASTDGLQLAEIRYFGGKAVNFGVLRRAIPDDSPVATTFSFDLWNAFVDQTLANSNTLRQEIDQRLAPFSYPPDMSALATTLGGIKNLIEETAETSYPAAARVAVLDTLEDPQYGFDPTKKIRFRSSTNVEDSDHFTGAGLYDSFSGCLADDLDGDGVGPSICDPSKDSERGVFRAIRKVFASFYNTNAYLERLRHGIDESEVGMAILAHHSFPDELELANGVGTLEQRAPGWRSAYLVTQDGSSSVTNPEPGAIPEEVDVYISVSLVFPTVIRQSNLVPIGATVMDFPDEYVALTGLLTTVADEFELASGLSEFVLELEYKKMAPGGDLIVKQVRRVPQADDTPSITPFLVNEPTEYCLFQGEYGDVFANHRLKSRWTINTQNLWLTAPNLANSFYADATMQYGEVCQLYEQTGPLPAWPSATHSFAGGVASDGWALGNLQNPRAYRLSASGIPTLVAPSESPILVLTDFGPAWDYSNFGCLDLQVDYDRPVPSIDWMGATTTTTDYALLCRCPPVQTGDLWQQRTFTDPGGTMIDTTFYWPPPVDVAAGYTAPVSRFVQTTINGLTGTPMILTGEYSQTYRPEHHNFGEHFIFEPALEPGISQQQLDELAAASIRVIHVFYDFGSSQITFYSDGAWGDGCLACTGFDGDRDGRCTGDPTFDCDDSLPAVWTTPGEVRDLEFTGRDTLTWNEPVELGGTLVRYDTLRSADPGDYLTAVTCVESDDGSDRLASDGGTPLPGLPFYYLVRAENDCALGQGSLGRRTNGSEREGSSCP
jgi:hypothetical protein